MFQVFKTRNLPGGCFKRNSVAQGECLFLLKRRFPFKNLFLAIPGSGGCIWNKNQRSPSKGSWGWSSARRHRCLCFKQDVGMFPVGFQVKTASAGYKNIGTCLVHLCLGHTPCSPASGKHRGSAGLGVLLEMQVWGGFGSQTEAELWTWEGRSSLQVPQMSFRSKAKRFSVTLWWSNHVGCKLAHRKTALNGIFWQTGGKMYHPG